MVRKSTTLPHTEKFVGKEWNGTVGNWDSWGRQKIDLIVIHTMDGSMKGTLAWFNNENSKVSAHYGISTDGAELVQYVPEIYVAYHAGKYSINTHSIGIENADDKMPKRERPIEVIRKNAELVVDLCRFYGIPIDREHIKGHNEVTPGKSCPGSLDVDKIVSMAHDIHAAIVEAETPKTEPTAPATPPQNTPPEVPEVKPDTSREEEKIVQLLRDSMAHFKQKDGNAYSDLHNFVYDTLAQRVHTEEVMTPDTDGIPPVVIDSKEYDTLFTMANNFSTVADFYELTPLERATKDAGQKVVALIRDNQVKLIAQFTPVAVPTAPDEPNTPTDMPNFSTPVEVTPTTTYVVEQEKIWRGWQTDVLALAGAFMAKIKYAILKQ